MDESTRAHLANLYSDDKEEGYQAFMAVVAATDKPVDWAYDVWDALVTDLSHKDNHRRAIAAQVLCNLVKSDPESRMMRDFDSLFAVTRDARFVTARHGLQAIWKVGAAGPVQQKRLVDSLEQRFTECSAEKNYTLIRYDIIQGLRNLYNVVRDKSLEAKAQALIEMETDAKYRKKYAGIWKAK